MCKCSIQITWKTPARIMWCATPRPRSRPWSKSGDVRWRGTTGAGVRPARRRRRRCRWRGIASGGRFGGGRRYRPRVRSHTQATGHGALSRGAGRGVRRGRAGAEPRRLGGRRHRGAGQFRGWRRGGDGGYRRRHLQHWPSRIRSLANARSPSRVPRRIRPAGTPFTPSP